MAISWTIALAVLGFAVVLGGTIVLTLRSVERRAAARDRALLVVLEQIRGRVDRIEGAATALTRAQVEIAGEVVALDAETLARLEALGIHVDEGGGMDALYAALERGMSIAERGFEAGAKAETAPDERGRVIPLRPREKPPGKGGEGGSE